MLSERVENVCASSECYPRPLNMDRDNSREIQKKLLFLFKKMMIRVDFLAIVNVAIIFSLEQNLIIRVRSFQILNEFGFVMFVDGGKITNQHILIRISPYINLIGFVSMIRVLNGNLRQGAL